MKMECILLNGEFWNLHSGFSPNYRDIILKGAVVRSTKSDSAELTVQELSGEHYSIRYSIGRFFKKIKAEGTIKIAGLYSCFMLKHGLRKEVSGIGKLHIRQDQYTSFFTEQTSCVATFESDAEYRAIDIFYSPSLLEELIPFFPELKAVLDSSTVVLPGKVRWCLPSMKEIINQVLNCPYDEATRQFYIDLKVRELLYQMLETAFKRNDKEYYFTPWEIKRIHDARSILETYISKKPPLIRALSKQVALNEFKLKTGFKQHFNSGIFEWLIEQKMQEAKKLLLTTNKPIKEIASMVGYPLSTSFITAFRRRFGMTPRSLRRQ